MNQTQRNAPNWKPYRKGTIDNLFGNLPSADTVYIPIVNKTKTKTIYVYMKSDEAEEFAEKILETVNRVKQVQKARSKNNGQE